MAVQLRLPESLVIELRTRHAREFRAQSAIVADALREYFAAHRTAPVGASVTVPLDAA